jgi:hypothetical protein
MGFDSTRPKKVRPGDYVALVGAATVTLALVLWAFFG